MSRANDLPRPFLGPLRVSSDEFEEIEPIIDEQGRVRRRVRHKLSGAIGVEVIQELIHCDLVSIQPMEVPSASIFYDDYICGFDWN
jgi:hypothetical protein